MGCLRGKRRANKNGSKKHDIRIFLLSPSPPFASFLPHLPFLLNCLLQLELACMSFPITPLFGPGGPSKMPIPPLKRHRDDENQPKASPSQRRPRVPRACVRCRRRKVKCGGEKPRCQNCLSNEEPCVYVQGRRDRLKASVRSLTDIDIYILTASRVTGHNQSMINFLKRIRGQVAEEHRLQIEELLREVYQHVRSPLQDFD
jgi:hypothetical protein